MITASGWLVSAGTALAIMLAHPTLRAQGISLEGRESMIGLSPSAAFHGVTRAELPGHGCCAWMLVVGR